MAKFLLFMFLHGLLFMAVVLALETSLFERLAGMIKVSAALVQQT